MRWLAVTLSLLAIGSCTLSPETAPRTIPIAPTRVVNASSDGLVLFREFVTSLNSGDANGALRVLSDDVSWERGGQCPERACIGKEAAQREIQRDVANHHVLSIISADRAGESWNVKVDLRTDGTRRANVERIVQVFSLEVRGQKIAKVHVTVDTSDPATAAFQAAQGRAGQ